ncbi:MAG: hypothetical protein IPJ88_06565 [Myxococcales bacterium]|nr:MAG: hypothetical protein IPJ88_06565 [Myxococcales bacterium]
MSEMSWGGGHHSDNLPVLVAGPGIQGAEHIVVPYSVPGAAAEYNSGPKYANGGNTELRSLLLTAMQAAGVPITEYAGETTTIDGLWTPPS